ncbi:sugar phosphate isomerase/epimerase family protein [Paracoccus sp. (in: a-proteobacteria)]|uniref:sugar phosphate isomerase/epimerase family protein n=1 Tax=Paracoccus sp. TaxID=267 RepID=UPI003A89D526
MRLLHALAAAFLPDDRLHPKIKGTRHMQFGVHSLVWNDAQETLDIEFGMERAKAAGYSFFELPGINRGSVDIARIARTAQSLEIELGASCGLAPEYDVSSDDPAVVKAGEAVLNEAVSIARDLGSKGMSGPIFSGHQKYRVMPTQKNWDTSVAVLTRVAEKAQAAGVALSLELVNRYETNLMNTVKQGLAYIARPCRACCGNCLAARSGHVKARLFRRRGQEASA